MEPRAKCQKVVDKASDELDQSLTKAVNRLSGRLSVRSVLAARQSTHSHLTEVSLGL